MKKTSSRTLFFVAALTCLGALSYVGARAFFSSQPSQDRLGPETPPTQTVSAHPKQSTSSARSREVAKSDLRHEKEIRDIPLASNLNFLSQRSRDDAGLSYALASALQDCANLGLEEEAYLEKAESVEYGRSFEAEQAKALAEKQRQCEGVEDSAQLRYELVDRAAASGVLQAQIAFRVIAADFISSEAAMRRGSTMEEYKKKVLEYAYAAARSGSPEALFNAYDVTSSGLFAPRNDRLAYTYLYAYSRIKPSPRTSHLLAAESRHLSASDLAIARSAAENILARSTNKGAVQ